MIQSVTLYLTRVRIHAVTANVFLPGMVHLRRCAYRHRQRVPPSPFLQPAASAATGAISRAYQQPMRVLVVNTYINANAAISRGFCTRAPSSMAEAEAEAEGESNKAMPDKRTRGPRKKSLGTKDKPAAITGPERVRQRVSFAPNSVPFTEGMVCGSRTSPCVVFQIKFMLFPL